MFGARNAFMTRLAPPSGPAIGSALGGGFYAGKISTAGNGIADYNLVIGPLSSTQNQLKWKTTNTSTAGTSSVIDGPTNSSTMNNASHPAAQWVEALTVGGQTDWYMPAKNELEICFFNLKPTTAANNTGSGINANAVPARASNYTAGNPAQTSAAAFQSPSGAEQFSGGAYWSSTEYSSLYANYQQFAYATQSTDYKVTSNRVRAVRRIAV